MAKLLALFALITLMALITLSVVSAATTTRAGSDEEEECKTPTPIEKLGKCVGYLSEGISSDDKLLPRMVVNGMPASQEYSLSDCCSELKEVTEDCRCNAIQQVFDEARVKATTLYDLSELANKAVALPFFCKVGDFCPIEDRPRGLTLSN